MTNIIYTIILAPFLSLLVGLWVPATQEKLIFGIKISTILLNLVGILALLGTGCKGGMTAIFSEGSCCIIQNT
ncbi:MAG: hypothetical protein R2795_02265 [Saprospiraceae bacterium]